MKTVPQHHHWLIDAVLFLGFLVSYLLDVTGLALHEWLGVAVGILAVYHLLVHWQWVQAVTRRLVGRTSGEARWFYTLDVGLTIGFLTILVTGVVISTWLNLPLQDYLAWRDVHILSSLATLLLTVIKIGFHWKWIVCVAKRSIFKPLVPVLTTGGKPAPLGTLASRRDFLRLMGAVGVSAFLVSYRAVETALGVEAGPSGVEPEPSLAALTEPITPTPPAEMTGRTSSVSRTAVLPTATPANTTLTTEEKLLPTSPATATAINPAATIPLTSTVIPTSTIAAATPGAVAAVAPCVVRCSKGCSYPGQCRKYTDTNRNGRCDLGECI